MSCVKCQSTLLCQSDTVGYSCGHCYHIACILKTKLSIHKPTCPSCGQGSLICNSYKEKEKEKEREPQLIHYIIALILISLVVSYLLF